MESKLCSSFPNKANPITINCSTPTSLFCWLLCSCHCHIPHLPKKFTNLSSNTLVHSRTYPTPLKAQNLSGSQFYADLISPPCESYHHQCHYMICATSVLSSYSNCHPQRVAISGQSVRICDGGKE